ncbi:MAG TPA: DUF92 domain-containing protein, partial [Ktedonobacteraceae bacterium]|nr:DUF92 domain-containing protein [Ktedonobacteraceae bacterium]
SLVFFFVSSSAFSHYREREKARVADDKFSKGSQRDIAQAAANGGLATLLAAWHGITTSPTRRSLLQAAYAGALAAATADTWATELGVLSSEPPRSIITGKLVAPGTSGGITRRGMAAATLGALALGMIFWAMEGFHRSLAWLPLIACPAGLAGSVADSLLGATLQAVRYCPACQTETERRVHNCGTTTIHLRGLRWLNNDGVNFVATLTGSLTALVLRLLVNAWKPLNLTYITRITRRNK